MCSKFQNFFEEEGIAFKNWARLPTKQENLDNSRINNRIARFESRTFMIEIPKGLEACLMSPDILNHTKVKKKMKARNGFSFTSTVKAFTPTTPREN
mmetsp:Transcript_28330/g.39387  ORF Transcript_28330/g.39387 Transcript_28330/m.39387 type:complete len:97 (-) Transcript_28330:1698-1988(-)